MLSTLFLLGCLPVATAFPLVLIDENFESYTTVPVSINGLNPGDGNDIDWSSVGTAGDGISDVVVGSSTGGAGANQRVLRLFSPDQSSSARASRLFQNPVNLASGTPQVNATFKLHLGGELQDQVFRLIGEGINDSISALRVSGTTTLRYLNAPDGPGQGSVWVTIPAATFEFDLNDWYEVSVIADLNTQSWSFSVTNISDSSNSVSIGDINFIDDQTTISGWRSLNRSGSFGPGDVYIDDLLITAIPEPSTWLMGLAVFGLAGAFGLRRRLRGRGDCSKPASSFVAHP